MSIDDRIDIVAKILDLANNGNEHSNRKDIRNVSTHILGLTIQNYLITLILSRNLSNIDYLKNNIYEGYEKEDIPDLEYNFGGYQTNAFFINLFEKMILSQIWWIFGTKVKQNILFFEINFVTLTNIQVLFSVNIFGF